MCSSWANTSYSMEAKRAGMICTGTRLGSSLQDSPTRSQRAIWSVSSPSTARWSTSTWCGTPKRESPRWTLYSTSKYIYKPIFHRVSASCVMRTSAQRFWRLTTWTELRSSTGLWELTMWLTTNRRRRTKRWTRRHSASTWKDARQNHNFNISSLRKRNPKRSTDDNQ